MASSEERNIDKELHQRWVDSLPPFNGFTLLFDDSVHVIVGTAIVRFFLEDLAARFGHAESFLVNEDWHAHDGFIKDSEIISTAELISELSTHPDKWICISDDLVYRGVYDATYHFYLRFGLEEDEPDTMMVALTSDERTVRELAGTVRSAFNVTPQIVEAKSYFDRVYGG